MVSPKLTLALCLISTTPERSVFPSKRIFFLTPPIVKAVAFATPKVIVLPILSSASVAEALPIVKATALASNSPPKTMGLVVTVNEAAEFVTVIFPSKVMPYGANPVVAASSHVIPLLAVNSNPL